MREQDENSPSKHYEVGYGKPPLATRFQPGVSGNPKNIGKKPKNREATILELLDEPHRVVEGGKVSRMPAAMIMMRKQIANAMKGDLRALQFLLEYRERIKASRAAQSQNDLALLTEEEVVLLESLVVKMQRR